MVSDGAGSTDHLRAVLDVGAALVSTQVLEEALAGVVQKIGEAMGVSLVDMWTYASERQALTYEAFWSRAGTEPEDAAAVGTVVALDGRADLRELIEGKRVIERHIDDPDLSDLVRTGMEKRGHKSTLDAPLTVGDEVLGILGLVETRTVRRFVPADHELFAALCAIAAMGIHNAHLSRRQEEQKRRLLRLLRSSQAMTASLSAQESIESIRNEIGRLISGRECHVDVFLLQENGAYERFVAPGSDEEPGDSITPAKDDTLAQRALDARRPVIAKVGGVRTRLIIPLVFKDAASGYIDLSGLLSREITKDEVGFMQIFANHGAVAVENARLYRAAERQAATDVVTGLYNRWYFYERLYSEIARADRYKQPLSLIMVEIDDHETFVASRGRVDGDDVLRGVGRLMTACLRNKVDVPCRLGGGTFAILLPTTPCAKPGALLVGERLQKAVESTEFRNEDHVILGRFTLSQGLAGFPRHADDADELVAAAEEALRAARREGTNRIRVHGART